MIVRDEPESAWALFAVVHGSVVGRILPQVATVAGLSFAVVALQRSGQAALAPVAPVALLVIGSALAVFSAFRNAAAYDRWWEARRLLGGLLSDACSLARQARSHLGHGDAQDTDRSRRIALRCVAFVHCVRATLRGQPVSEDAAARYLPVDERAALGASRDPQQRLLCAFSEDIAAALAARSLEPAMAHCLEQTVHGPAIAFSGVERIKATPMPFAYVLLVRRTAYLFCLLLPLGLADVSGWWTPLLVAIVAYAFFGLDAVARELASPFGESANALPLDALARQAEARVLELLGETELPPPLEPRRFVLS